MIAIDPELAPLVDLPAVPVRGTAARDLATAGALVLAGADAWDRLRTLRTGNVRVGAVVVGGAEPPDDRARLEPVVVVPRPERDALAEAIATVSRARPAGTVRLVSGVADLDRGRFVRVDGAEVPLTGLETRLVAYLATRAGRAVERDELQRQVWDHAKVLPTKTVEMTVARLRKKIEPDPARPVSILTVRGGGYRAVPVAESPAAPPLPRAPAGRFVGRAALVDELAASLAAGTALALWGTPGVGKSRLALELLQRLGGGAHVDLHGTASVSLATALATALGAPAAADPTDAALHALRGARALVLDDADDHLPALAELVPRCAALGVRLVVTSRRLPRLVGLRAREVPPLTEDEGVELLEDRAGPIPDAGAVVRALDGLPLALELAAPRLPGIGSAAFLAALEAHGAGWLAADGHRHASLSAALGASWGRLAPELRAGLAGLAVFRGSFGVPDARAVAGVDPLGLATLAEHGLVARDGDRFRLLRVVARHAAAADPAAAAISAGRYVEHLRAVGTRLAADLGGFAARAAFAALASAAPDLRHALDHATAPGAVADLVLALDALRSRLGTDIERVELLEEGLARTAPDPASHGRVWLRRASLWTRLDAARARAALQRARALAPDDPEVVEGSRLAEAKIAGWTESPRAALACLEPVGVARDPRRALVIDAHRTNWRMMLGELPFIDGCELIGVLVDELVAEGALVDASATLLLVTQRWVQWAPGRALPLLERLAAWAEAGSDPRNRIGLLHALAAEQAAVGAVARAHRTNAAAEALAAAVEPARLATLHAQRAELFVMEGRYDEARPLILRAVAWWRRRGSATGEYGALEAEAVLECDAGRPGAALRAAERALDAGRRSGNPHVASHAHLLSAAVALIAGDPPLARAALDGLEPDHLSELGRVQLGAVRTALAATAGGVDPEGWRLATELPPAVSAPWVARAQELHGAWRAGDRDELARRADPAEEPLAELRLVARIWLASAPTARRLALA